MELYQQVQANFINRINGSDGTHAGIDGGYVTVSKKMGCSMEYLRRALGLDGPYRPRIKTLEKIKIAIDEVEKEQIEHLSSLIV